MFSLHFISSDILDEVLNSTSVGASEAVIEPTEDERAERAQQPAPQQQQPTTQTTQASSVMESVLENTRNLLLQNNHDVSQPSLVKVISFLAYSCCCCCLYCQSPADCPISPAQTARDQLQRECLGRRTASFTTACNSHSEYCSSACTCNESWRACKRECGCHKYPYCTFNEGINS